MFVSSRRMSFGALFVVEAWGCERKGVKIGGDWQNRIKGYGVYDERCI